MTAPARPPLFLLPPRPFGALLVAAALAGCSVGIDDHPVPPGLIPGVADAGASGTNAPAESYASVAPAPDAEPIVMAAAPAPVAASEPMVWRKGPAPTGTGAGAEAPGVASSQADIDAPGPAEPAAAEPETAASDGEPEAVAPEQAEPQTASADAAPDETEPTATAHAGSFRMAPFVGLDAAEGAPLLAALRAQAGARGVALDGGREAMVFKTYLSSYPDGDQTVLTYVFDIYSADGTRLTRIDGQETQSTAVSGWSDAPAATVNAVAKKAMRRLEAWQDGAQA